jgi:hypothetical protein
MRRLYGTTSASTLSAVRLLPITLVLASLAGACSPGLPECGPPPEALAGTPELPPMFPTPGPMTFTGDREAGPSRVVEGYWAGELEEAYEGWLSAFPEAGYGVTFDEIETNDAEVNFAGGATTGQVKMVQTCSGRVTTSIVIRPD